MQEKIIKALCNPTRLKLIKCMSEKSMSVGELINVCGLSQSAVSQHLAKLRNAGLVRDTRVGREVRYAIANSNLKEISSFILNLSERFE